MKSIDLIESVLIETSFGELYRNRCRINKMNTLNSGYENKSDLINIKKFFFNFIIKTSGNSFNKINIDHRNRRNSTIYQNSRRCGFGRTFLFLVYLFVFLIVFVINCNGYPVEVGFKLDKSLIKNYNVYDISSSNKKVEFSNSAVVPRNKRRITSEQQPKYTNQLITYLQDYGYLQEADEAEVGELKTDDKLITAIKTLQAFGRIPETGKLDEKTIHLLNSPRCGQPDFAVQKSKRSKRYTIQGQKWNKKDLTWSLQLKKDSQYQYRAKEWNIRHDIRKALDIWSSNSQLTFHETTSTDADIIVTFHRYSHGDNYPFDGKGSILAHAFFPGTGRGGDAHFDEDEDWKFLGDRREDGTSFYNVAAHEFGHSLGLSHSSVKESLMDPWYKGWSTDSDLPDDDRVGIQQLYGARDKKLWAPYPGYNPEGQHPKKPYTTPRYTQQPTTTQRPTTTTPHPRGDKPDTCDMSYDAISIIRSDLFIFKGQYMWRINDHGLFPDYPALTKALWSTLPDKMTKVDAVYEKLNHHIVFFVGRNYYEYDGTTLLAGYPKDISRLGLPKNLDHVDGAMVWSHNSKTYFFSGTSYWRYDEDIGKVEGDYPRDMSIWRGVGYYIDDVFQWKDGKTYFFKGKGFWEFDDMHMRVANKRQSLSAPYWMGCPNVSSRDAGNRENRKSKFTSVVTRKTVYNGNTNGFEETEVTDEDDSYFDDDDNSGSSINKKRTLNSIIVVSICYILIQTNIVFPFS